MGEHEDEERLWRLSRKFAERYGTAENAFRAIHQLCSDATRECAKCGKVILAEEVHWDTIHAENDLPYCDACWEILKRKVCTLRNLLNLH